MREFLYLSFARKLTQPGYEVESSRQEFRIDGIAKDVERAFSERTRQRLAFEERYEEVFGDKPTKRRVEQFIKGNRGAAEARFKAEYQTTFGKVPSSRNGKRWGSYLQHASLTERRR